MSARLSRTSPSRGGAVRTTDGCPLPSISSHQLVDRDAGAAADVECAASLRRARAARVRLGDVGDVDEVARLLAVAEDRHRFAVQQPVGEDRNHVAVGVVALVAGRRR